MNRGRLLRILDANLNRSREGLRVCEEITRFVLNDKSSTARLKAIRHRITKSMLAMPISRAELLLFRDSKADVGKKTTSSETKRQDFSGIFFANMERSKESLRVLEECCKLIDQQSAERFKKSRFAVYALEKTILPKLDAIRHHG